MELMKKSFDKGENWDLFKFFQIYEDVDGKKLKFIGATGRADMGKNYLSWICAYYPSTCEMYLKDILEWDIYYQIDKLFKREIFEEIEVEPYECFQQANKWILGDGSGSQYIDLLKITENTPCGFYYGN